MQLPLDQWRMAQQIKLWPMDEWPLGWLQFKIAMLLHRPEYLKMTNRDRKAARLPVTRQEMVEFIKSRDVA